MKLERAFYERDTLVVARELLGAHLVHKSREGTTVGKIVETEAYIGPHDKASHAYKGRLTKRTSTLFGPGGHAYVYQIYGLYYCFNIVTRKSGMPEAVFIRALEPVEGIDLMSRRRNLSHALRSKSNLENLANGPSKLCIAMGIDRSLNGTDLCGDDIYLTRSCKGSSCNGEDSERGVICTPRVNIDYAEEAKNYPWRFYLGNSKCVSNPKHK